MDFHYVTFPLNALLMIAWPIILASYVSRKFKLDWGLWLIGGATFILSQVGHIPFNLWVGSLFKNGLLSLPAGTGLLVFTAVFGGLSAGLWEELSRYAMFRWWLKEARNWQKGIFTGAGHGGAEAIILGVLGMVAFFQLSAYRNMDLSTVVPAAQLELAQMQISSYWSAPWYATLLGAVERFFAIPSHIAFSVIVLQTFIRKQRRWVWLAVLYHALLDGTIVLLVRPLGMYWIEAIIGGFAILSLIIIFALRQPEPESITPQPAPVTATPITLKPLEETNENLDASKYQ